MAGVGQKIDIASFEIASGIILGFSVVLAIGRMSIKINKFHRLFIDDVLFIIATVLLIAGTVMVFLTLPYNQTEVDVGAGVESPPPDLTHQLDFDVKFQDVSTVLLNASIFSVKFSFLFFFRLLLQRTGKLQIWWWCAFIITIPCAIVCICTEFMVCPAFGDRILEVCVSDSALKRQIAVLYTVVVLDIFTDLLLISIPILLLWSVKINLRRKVGLGSLLCLSIFAIITNIIRAAGHKLSNGQDDVVWILFWGEIEACVAVIANSMTAFRSLFVAGSSQLRLSPREPPQDNSPGHAGTKSKRRGVLPRLDLPSIPTATFSGLRSMLSKDPFADDDNETTMTRSEGTTLNRGSESQYTRSVNTGSTQGSQSGTHRDWYEKNTSAHENWV